MRLKHLRIENFRAINKVDVTFEDPVAVIVGPNAIGKTTILEAIRMAKAILAPRTQNEATQVLVSMGAVMPYAPQAVRTEALMQNQAEPLLVHCRYELTPTELGILAENLESIALDLALASVGQTFVNQGQLAQFLATPMGSTALQQAKQVVRDGFDTVSKTRSCRLNLKIDSQTGATGEAFVEQAFIAFLDRSHPPATTLFSYFPADRALPPGEQPIQLGSQDAAAQVESHNSQAQTKYLRLKNAIFGTVVASNTGREEVLHDFSKIFDGVLAGRSISEVGVNNYGLLSVRVRDDATGRVFDLDSMSSGEKGLILTFFLISRSIAEGGLILLDEPELHLNPSVCRILLSFLVREYIAPKHAQAIICSHSPEVLSSALDIDGCSLYHMVSDSDLRLFRPSDEIEISNALSRLGTSHIESLLYKGTLFVEGGQRR